MIKEIGCSFASYYFGTQNEMNHFCQVIHSHQDGVIKLKGGRSLMKSMEIEDHGDARINNG